MKTFSQHLKKKWVAEARSAIRTFTNWPEKIVNIIFKDCSAYSQFIDWSEKVVNIGNKRDVTFKRKPFPSFF